MQEEWPLKYSATCLIFQKVEARSLLMVRSLNVELFTTIKHSLIRIKHLSYIFASICVQKTKLSHEIVNVQESNWVFTKTTLTSVSVNSNRKSSLNFYSINFMIVICQIEVLAYNLFVAQYGYKMSTKLSYYLTSFVYKSHIELALMFDSALLVKILPWHFTWACIQELRIIVFLNKLICNEVVNVPYSY